MNIILPSPKSHSVKLATHIEYIGEGSAKANRSIVLLRFSSRSCLGATVEFKNGENCGKCILQKGLKLLELKYISDAITTKVDREAVFNCATSVVVAVVSRRAGHLSLKR